MIITTVAKVADDGTEHIDFQPKLLIELSRCSDMDPAEHTPKLYGVRPSESTSG